MAGTIEAKSFWFHSDTDIDATLFTHYSPLQVREVIVTTGTCPSKMRTYTPSPLIQS